MNTDELSRAMLFLAFGGVDPVSKKKITEPSRAKRINAIMLTCGHYDASGEFAFNVGLPGKSGVGGGIVAIIPGKMSLSVWSPGLNKYGNSHAGTIALEKFTTKTGLSIF
jgi:glutaminase